MSLLAPLYLSSSFSVKHIVHALAVVSEVMASVDIWHDLDTIFRPLNVVGEFPTQLVHHGVVDDSWVDPVASWPLVFWN